MARKLSENIGRFTLSFGRFTDFSVSWNDYFFTFAAVKLYINKNGTTKIII